MHTLGFIEGGTRCHVAGGGSSAGKGERLAGEESEGGESGGGELHFGGRFWIYVLQADAGGVRLEDVLVLCATVLLCCCSDS